MVAWTAQDGHGRWVVAYWILKSEPDEWSWDDQVRAGVDVWDGVTNPQAVRNLKAMRRGDLALFYHTGDERRAVGLVEVVREAYPDPKDPTGRRVVVDVRAVRPLPRPVTLAEIKADPALSHLALVRQPRLSVVPVDAASWRRLLRMGGA
jgi:predicted RNA-binding protein with PUA-like domain